ncbi:alpha/beta hydrolase [Zavarzinella formosa]|uniref:alpha/beta hydrolase n=1 Tax=Zavarzinella formosa TaxID=360055 RepID=UPI0003149DA6|nr:alpha/beta hydrolase-fold protein [Zavarzinella formosa]
MTAYRIAFALIVSACLGGSALARPTLFDGPFVDLDRLNRSLHGRVDEYTHNHGRDNRICSKALGEKRDLYVYVPPGYDPEKRYPIVYWLHGFAQDEKTFLDLIETFDCMIWKGRFPKCVLVSADGSSKGRASYFDVGTFYLNSPLGRYEDYMVNDIWNFVVTRYSIRVEREAHVLAGGSMGGFGAYNLGFKHREQFGVLIGIMPALNIRYADCHGRTDRNFDPNCMGFATEYRPRDTIANFAGGLIKVKQQQVIAPVFGEGPDTIKKVSAENPAEMLFTHDIKPGEFQMFAGYGSDDEFNFDAGVQSFAYLAKQRGIDVTTYEVKGGRHNRETGYKMMQPFADWVLPRLGKYAPD